MYPSQMIISCNMGTVSPGGEDSNDPPLPGEEQTYELDQESERLALWRPAASG